MNCSESHDYDDEDRNHIEKMDDMWEFITLERDLLRAERDRLKKRVEALEARINES